MLSIKLVDDDFFGFGFLHYSVLVAQMVYLTKSVMLHFVTYCERAIEASLEPLAVVAKYEPVDLPAPVATLDNGVGKVARL